MKGSECRLIEYMEGSKNPLLRIEFEVGESRII